MFGQPEMPNPNLDDTSSRGKTETYAYSPDGLLKVYWLQKRNNIMLAIEDYQKRKAWGARAPTVFIFSRLDSLWRDLEPALKRRWKGKAGRKKLVHLTELMQESKKAEPMLEAFSIMNEWLDEIGITRVDTRVRHNATNPEEENRARRY